MEVFAERAHEAIHGQPYSSEERGAVALKHVDHFRQQAAVTPEPFEQRPATDALCRALNAPVVGRRRCGGSRAGHRALDGRQQIIGAERLREIRVHPGLETTFTISGHGVRRHGNDRQVRASRSLALANESRGFETVHLWHLHVHQDKVELLRRDAFDRFAARPGDDHRVSNLLEQCHDEFLVRRVVLGRKDAKRAR